MNCFLSISLKISRDSCLLTVLGQILDEKYLFLRENSQVFLTKKYQHSEIRHFYFEKDQKKNVLPFTILSAFFTKLLTESGLLSNNFGFFKTVKKPPNWFYFAHFICEEKKIEQI